jgi:mono/diheme cytochrome c family protein
MQRRYLVFLSVLFALTYISITAARSSGSATGADSPSDEQVARGKYLVTFGGCHDCHTPHKMGPNGPEEDMTRMLSGHPSDMTVTPPATAPGAPWMFMGTGSFTAFAGPWGVSFTANLTPDKETGLGNWTEEQFIMALRNGRHEGKGRPILPPMPFKYVSSLTDDDLKAVFAYLRSIPAVRNKVPSPIDPPEGKK